MTFKELRSVYPEWRRVCICNQKGYPLIRKQREVDMAEVPEKYDDYEVVAINPCESLVEGRYAIQVFTVKKSV